MKEFKGTRTKKGELKWIRSRMGFQVLTADSYYSICETVGKRGQEEQVANAQLIAAAPAMLEDLIDIIKESKYVLQSAREASYCHDCYIDTDDLEDLVKRAEETINKALGI